MDRTDPAFSSGDGRSAWLYRPAEDGAGPCVVMAHGYTGSGAGGSTIEVCT